MAQGLQRDLLRRFLIDFIQIDLKMKSLAIISLGLSISKQIVEAHGGSIEALNRLNQKNECWGSVKVTFPEIKNKF